MGADRLNARQEKFVQELAKGTTQRQAYLLSYPGSRNWKPETVDAKASLLANRDKVSARLRELQLETEKRNAISREAVIEQLKRLGFVDWEKRQLRPSDSLKALEIIVRILGYEKQGADGKGVILRVVYEDNNELKP